MFQNLPAGHHPRKMSGQHPQLLHRRRIVGLDPVGQRAAQVHQRIPQGGHLPVQDANDPQVRRPQNDVVEFEIVVNDSAPVGFRRHMGDQPIHDRLVIRDVVGPCRTVPSAPSLYLAPHITVRSAQVGQSRRMEINPVELQVRIDQPSAQGFSLLFGKGHSRRQIAPQDDALEPAHEIEGLPQHG